MKIRILSNSDKQRQKHEKSLKLLVKMKPYVLRLSSSGLNDSCREVRTLKISQEVDGR
jgi:hypothetical protein